MGRGAESARAARTFQHSCLTLPARRHRALKNAQAIPVFRQTFAAPRPAWVLQRVDVSLGMRHQAEDAAGRIADSGNGAGRSIRVGGILDRRLRHLISILQYDPARLFEPV